MITPFSYLLFLLSLLVIYLGFLILPRGFKAQYCLGSRRRYRRKRRRRSTVAVPSSRKQFHDEEAPNTTKSSQLLDNNKNNISTGIQNHTLPKHVNVRSMIEERVRHRFTQPPGLRLIAHGIKVRPRPVWIQLHVDDNIIHGADTTSELHNCLTWRAELKASSSSQEGAFSNNTPSLGSIRKVSLTDIIGIELGQKTVALKRLQSVRESECFSILTSTGTLDLQCVSSPDVGGASAEDVRKACLDYLTSVLSSNNVEVGTMLSSPARTIAVSTISF
mmetsp:Transcript_2195/g.4000  ORF Transcript_2195/g.4000 Transcript_2195/m.4000 type:complete len:276 (+) Transcript_2195:34-861(+)